MIVLLLLLLLQSIFYSLTVLKLCVCVYVMIEHQCQEKSGKIGQLGLSFTDRKKWWSKWLTF